MLSGPFDLLGLRLRIRGKISSSVKGIKSSLSLVKYLKFGKILSFMIGLHWL